LMSVAQAQNTFTAEAQTPLEIFNQSLQRAILSRLATQTLNTLFGADRQLTVGTYETAGFIVDVTDDGTGVLTITTTDKNTGAVVSFVVSDGGL
jgi:curli production assembly/transport component CsgF